MDQARFLEACRWALSGEGAPQGIGTLGEKALHRAVKYYFQPDSQQREVPVPPYVGILEVQTRSFRRLRPKLQAFLSQGPVTVVYPVPAKKTVAWLTEEGEVTPAHKSPLKPTAGSVLPELYQLGELLFHPNLRLCVLLLEVAGGGVGALPPGVRQAPAPGAARPVYQPGAGEGRGPLPEKGHLGRPCPAQAGRDFPAGEARQRLPLYPGRRA